MAKFLGILIALGVSGLAHAETVPGEQAKKNGVLACQQAVEDTAKFVVNGNQHSSLATWNNVNSDARLFNAQIAVKYSDGNSVAILNVAPTRTGKCDSSYTTIFATDKSCSVVRETIFKDWRFSSESAGLIVLENKDATVNKILLPSGSGCTAITTEVVYR